MIGGTIVATFASIMLVQLGTAQNISSIAGRDLVASRLVTERLEAARGKGARVACAAAGTVVESVSRGQRPYTVKTTTTAVTEQQHDAGAGRRFTTRHCEVTVEVTFKPNSDPRTVKASTRLYL